jgi:hypothetical protein
LRRAFTGTNLLCPQTATQYNGIWYYGGLNCNYTPPAPTTFTYGSQLSPLPANCNSGTPPCITPSKAPAPLRRKGHIPHYVHESPCLTRRLKPNMDQLLNKTGSWAIISTQPVTLKLTDNDKRPVLLMLLLSLADNPVQDDPGFYIHPVGQEYDGPGGQEITPDGHPRDCYWTATFGLVQYHVIVVR